MIQGFMTAVRANVNEVECVIDLGSTSLSSSRLPHTPLYSDLSVVHGRMGNSQNRTMGMETPFGFGAGESRDRVEESADGRHG